MDTKEINDFYERLYFHELNSRDSIHTRAQINFALIFTGLSVIAYMLRVLDFTENSDLAYFCAFFLCISIGIFIWSGLIAKKAFYGGQYKAVADPTRINEYRELYKTHINEVEKYNKEYPDNLQEVPELDKAMADFVKNQIIECTTHNTHENVARFSYIHDSLQKLLYSAVALLIGSTIFILADLDASSPRKEFAVKNKTLVTEVTNLNTKINEQLNIQNRTINDNMKIINEIMAKHLNSSSETALANITLLTTLNENAKSQISNINNTNKLLHNINESLLVEKKRADIE